MDILLVSLGALGAAIMIIAFFLQQQGSLPPQKPAYHIINSLGAGMVLISLIHQWNLHQFILEAVWIVASAYGIFRTRKRLNREVSND